jgi:hypothetical protein
MAENPRESNGYMAKLHEGERVIPACELATGGIVSEKADAEIIERIRATKGDLVLPKRESNDLIESLAALEHEQWVAWSKAVAHEVSEDRRKRWETYWVPYNDLDEETKEKDREWARKVAEIIAPDNGGLNTPTTGVGPGRDITLRLDVDVADALTGLKALRREADRAVAALKALEEAVRTWNFRRDEYVLWEGELHRVICADEDTAVLAPSRHYPEEGRTNTDYTRLFAVSNRPELFETIADRVARVDDDIPVRPEISE